MNALLNKYLWKLRYERCKFRTLDGKTLSGCYRDTKKSPQNPDGRGHTLTQETDMEQAGRVTILDAALIVNEDQFLEFSVHDKRTDPGFNATAFGKYPPEDTLLQPKVSYLIVFSQCHRTHTIASTIPNFTVEIAAVIHELLCKGHPIKPLLQQFGKYLKFNHPLYPTTLRNPNNEPEFIYNATKDRVQWTWKNGLPRLEHRNKLCGFPNKVKIKQGQQLNWVPFEQI